MEERDDGRSVTIELPSSTHTPRAARAFLRDTLQTWELDGFGDVTELLADELVCNVVRHVGAPMQLRAVRRPSLIRIEVDDPSTEPPVLQNPDPLDERGRGILLVESLATSWGVDIRETGKTVWFEIDVDTATEEIHGSD
jgi:anti-sigma regulatory factor (Ser/Thr protein kinase)